MSSEMTIPDIQNQATSAVGSQVGQVNKVEPAKLVIGSAAGSSGPQVDNQQMPREEVNEVVIELNSMAQNLQRSLLFSIDEKSGQTFVKVMDKDTEETIREIPSKDIREIKAKLGETIGMIFRDSS